ncbi:Bax inhibitor-1/YccA family protein [Candidatus Ishikawella capsulata]|nr:Bax inhibitor-1/YccA family protein [Candidatus Ishikawaella capsulata]
MHRYAHTNSSMIRQNPLLQDYLYQVYGWMTCGLLLTAFVSWFAIHTPSVAGVLSSKKLVLTVMLLQFFVVSTISGVLEQLNSRVATMLFMFYSSLVGLTISSIVVFYTAASVSSDVVITAGIFVTISLYGYLTKQDLSVFHNLCEIGVIGVMSAYLVNIKLNSLNSFITYISVILFVFLTAYETQKLKTIYKNVNLNNQDQMRRYSIIGAMGIYLDFINFFMISLLIL